MEFRQAFRSFLMMGAHCGPLDDVCIHSIPFDDNFGMYFAGWELRVGGAIGSIIDLPDSAGRLDALKIPAESSGNFCRNFKGGIVEDCSGDLRPDVDRSMGSVLRVG